MWVKICGTTNLADARLAAGAGADAVGFVFAAASKRRVTAETVAGISRVLAEESAGVERIGVFETVDAREIVQQAREAGLTGVQLHGRGGVELALAVRAMAAELTVMAVAHWEMGAADAAERVTAAVAGFRAAGIERVLLDSKVGDAQGGTGVAFSWEAAAEALREVREGVKLVVAGGLRGETVAEAIRVLRPWGVDVASGVEATAGRKSEERVREFVAAARGGTGEG